QEGIAGCEGPREERVCDGRRSIGARQRATSVDGERHPRRHDTTSRGKVCRRGHPTDGDQRPLSRVVYASTSHPNPLPSTTIRPNACTASCSNITVHPSLIASVQMCRLVSSVTSGSTS